MYHIKRVIWMFVLLTAATASLTACGISDSDKSAMRNDLIARGFTEPVVNYDGSFDRPKYLVNVGTCGVRLTFFGDGDWRYEVDSDSLIDRDWRIKSANDLYVLGQAEGMFTNCGYTASPAPSITTVPKSLSFERSTPSGVVMLTGKPDDNYRRTYACASGTTTLVVPVGRTVSHKGTVVTIKGNVGTYSDPQGSVTLVMTAGPGATIPAVFVDTRAHDKRPDLYPQTAHKVGLTSGSSVSYVLSPYDYTNNYEDEGITQITACVK